MQDHGEKGASNILCAGVPDRVRIIRDGHFLWAVGVPEESAAGAVHGGESIHGGLPLQDDDIGRPADIDEEMMVVYCSVIC